MRRKFRHLIAAAATSVAVLATAPGAGAAVPDAFDGQLTCSAMTGANAGRVACQGVVHTWDGTNIDVNLFLPSDTPPAGGFPLIGVYHGWGGSKAGLDNRWLGNGYAQFSMSDRGWGASCGGTDPKRVTEAATGCAEGYNHLLDTRYEVRDAQHLIGQLVDDGIADPDRIGAIGGSYGGGMSMSLAALKDRIMLPDGSYAPWESPNGTAISLAGATPEIPWTDLAYSLQPNGATLDYVEDAPYRGPTADRRIGVLKQSFVAGLYATGQATSNYAVPGTDPDADLTTWYTSINAGEPYDTNPLSNEVVDEITAHHSSYYIDDSVAPAPLLISNGWTDDLFPADEAIRFYNRTRAEHQSAHISLFFLDYGHMRGRGATGDTAQLRTAQNAWLDHFVKGTGAPPQEDVNTLPQTCSGANPSGTLEDADNWAAIAPGEIRHTGADSQVIAPGGGNPATGQAYDPVAGGGACATADGADAPGAASYRLDPAPAGGFELIGSPTIVADFFIPNPGGQNSQVAARLLDVDTGSGDATLVARGLWRPKLPGLGSTTPVRQVFQLHPNRYRFAAGHVAKLELLPADQPYGRNSNGQSAVTVSNLELRLPVLEAPGSLGGLVDDPAGKVLPPGYDLAPDFAPDDDADDDGWPDDVDNCPGDANSNQVDSDGDGVGDACDLTDDDADDDGVNDATDNCPNDSNPTQLDSDGDDIGDVCDPTNGNDPDGDGVANPDDNCPDNSNPGQQDVDGDGIGNACDNDNDLDLDEDGVNDDTDNCTGTPNPGQQDSDGDGRGNACDDFNDIDFDEDGVPNASDNCVEEWNAGQQDSDGDSEGDACDDDDDNDGVADVEDACRTQAAMTADGCPFVPGTTNQPQTGQNQAGTTPSSKGKRKCKRLKTKEKRRRCRAKRKRR
jgi:predicted acyl esterase